MKRTVKNEFATFLTPAGVDLMSRVMRGEATMKFDKCRIGSGLWSVTKIADDEFEVDVPDTLLQPIDGGLFDIDSLEPKGSGLSEARVNVPPTFGPATVTEAAWLLDDDTVYAITRYAALPVLPVGSGSSSEVTLRAFLRVGDVDAVTLVIDSGVTASREYVDTEVEKVDQSLNARADQLDARVNDLPVSYLVTPPVVTGDAEQAYGNNATLSVSGGVSSWHNTAAAATIDHYEWIKPDKTTVEGPTLIWPIPNDAALVDTVYPFKVRAVDTLGNKSDWVEQDVKVVGNRRPVVTDFTHDVPAVAVKNQAVAVKFSGATDPDGDDAQITYRITSPINVTAGKSNDLNANEAVTLTFAAVAENTTAGITVVAVDQAGTQSAPTVITVDLRHQAIVEKPQGLAPAAGATDITRQPYLSSTPFAVNPAGFDTHKSTQVQIATDDQFTDIVLDMSVGAVTSQRAAQELSLDTQYYWRVRHEGNALGWGGWSDVMSFTTTAMAPGAVLPGGDIVAAQYAGNWLIVSPAAAWGINKIWGLSGIDVSAVTRSDGASNTTALVNGYSATADTYGNVGVPAAQHCRARGPQYFLPNASELSAILSAAAVLDATGKTNFAAMGVSVYWSSESNDANTARIMRKFSTAGAYTSTVAEKNLSGISRVAIPVRKLPI